MPAFTWEYDGTDAAAAAATSESPEVQVDSLPLGSWGNTLK